MKAKVQFFSFIVGFIVLLPFICNSKTRILENGYTLPKATDENVAHVIQQALDNLVFVEGGSFMMGDSGYIRNGQRVYWSPWEENFPVHKVTLDSFSISRYEVTFWEYDVFTDSIKTEPISMRSQHLPERRDNFPVGDVTWQQAHDYCHWLGKNTGVPFSLPTEAQWEYAARSRGLNVGYATDNGKMEPGRNHMKGGFGKQEIFPVGTFPANPLGLHEMSGNVSEWVWDWYDKNYYAKSPELNPKGPKTGIAKVLRGGAPTNSSMHNTVYGRSSHQIIFDDNDKDSLRTMYYYGFRCVVNSPQPIKR